MSEDRLVARIAKNAREEIRVALRHYKGHSFIDLRVHARGADGEMVPTAKGLTVKPEALPQLRQALVEADGIARAAGLVGDGET